MKTALLLLEIQNDYFPNGRMPLNQSLKASERAQDILNLYREHSSPVIHMQHISTQPNASYLLPCTRGAQFHTNVEPKKGEMVIKKHYPNCFKDTSLLNYLIKNQINHLTICGMMTQETIDASVRAAYDLGFSITVVADACASKQLEFHGHMISEEHVHNAFLAALSPNYAKVINSSELTQKTTTRMAQVA